MGCPQSKECGCPFRLSLATLIGTISLLQRLLLLHRPWCKQQSDRLLHHFFFDLTFIFGQAGAMWCYRYLCRCLEQRLSCTPTQNNFFVRLSVSRCCLLQVTLHFRFVLHRPWYTGRRDTCSCVFPLQSQCSRLARVSLPYKFFRIFFNDTVQIWLHRLPRRRQQHTVPSCSW